MRPRWTIHFADRLLSDEPKRRIRLIQTGVAIIVSLSGLSGMQYAAWAGFASWRAVVPWTVVDIVGYLGFLLAIRSGWSERFKDPALTVAQMIFSIAICATAYAIAGAMRGAIFPVVMVVLMFGIFALTPRQMLAVSLYAVGLFGAVMASMCRWQPEAFAPGVERGHFLMLATMMPAVSVLAGKLSELRLRLQRQKHDLTDALERIQFLATRDELTGLINRRQVSELLEKERQRSMRSGGGFCVALIDLDHFKRINDTHGHGAGDEALRAFAMEGSRRVRVTDSLGRWGGEEFMLLMPDSALPAAREAAERLRLALDQLSVPVGDAVLKLTLSAGVVQHEHDESIARMIERADLAMYRAKTQGRNQVVVE